MGLRRPGHLLERGLQFANSFSRLALSGGPPITSTGESTVRQMALADSITTIFTSLNLFLTSINNMIRANYGLPAQTHTTTSTNTSGNPLGVLGNLFDASMFGM